MCTWGWGRVPGVASGERTGFLSSYIAAKVLGVGKVEDGRICACGEWGKEPLSFLLRTGVDEIEFASLLFFSFLSMWRVGRGVYKLSVQTLTFGSDV